QAEDGIRGLIVTGVQTCALPICRAGVQRTGGSVETEFVARTSASASLNSSSAPRCLRTNFCRSAVLAVNTSELNSLRWSSAPGRSEERRVGKECGAAGVMDGEGG